MSSKHPYADDDGQGDNTVTYCPDCHAQYGPEEEGFGWDECIECGGGECFDLGGGF